jgi:hypothetical protein
VASRIRARSGPLALACALLIVLPAAASATTPRGFFGVVSQAGLEARDFERMDRGEVGTLRFPLQWETIEWAPGRYDWSAVDAILARAARAGVEPLPFIFGSPAWIAPEPVIPPLGSPAELRAWRSFIATAVERYGPGGAFWAGRAVRRPVRSWQVWNEPNFDLYWRPHPAPGRYARLLRAAAATIRAHDRDAEIVLAGIAPVHEGIPPWDFLERLYELPGIRRSFDTVALHPYSVSPLDLRQQLDRIRRIIVRAGDLSTPIAVTELGWASAGPRGPAVLGLRGQARMLRRAFGLLARGRGRWRIRRVSWYSWRDTEQSVEEGCRFCQHSGLFTRAGKAKPAWAAFRRFSDRP